MRCILFLAIAGIFISCTNSRSPISQQLSGSDSLVINFNLPQTNNIDKTVTTTEKKAIEKLINYLDSRSAETFKCSYDGNLLFYKKETLVGDVSFNFSGDGCHHFIQLLNDKLTPTVMSKEAANF